MTVVWFCQIGVALYLAALCGVAVAGALAPDMLPFVLALDRRGQRRILWGMAAAAAIEAITLMLGGFWS